MKNYELREKAPVPPSAMAIVAGGKEFGSVEEYTHGRFMASLSIGDPVSMLDCGFARGFGDTPEAAVADAFTTSRERAARYIRALEEVRGLVMGSEVVA